jgi:hypothetical protein
VRRGVQSRHHKPRRNMVGHTAQDHGEARSHLRMVLSSRSVGHPEVARAYTSVLTLNPAHFQCAPASALSGCSFSWRGSRSARMHTVSLQCATAGALSGCSFSWRGSRNEHTQRASLHYAPAGASSSGPSGSCGSCSAHMPTVSLQCVTAGASSGCS